MISPASGQFSKVRPMRPYWHLKWLRSNPRLTLRTLTKEINPRRRIVNRWSFSEVTTGPSRWQRCATSLIGRRRKGRSMSPTIKWEWWLDSRTQRRVIISRRNTSRKLSNYHAFTRKTTVSSLHTHRHYLSIRQWYRRTSLLWML